MTQKTEACALPLGVPDLILGTGVCAKQEQTLIVALTFADLDSNDVYMATSGTACSKTSSALLPQCHVFPSE